MFLLDADWADDIAPENIPVIPLNPFTEEKIQKDPTQGPTRTKSLHNVSHQKIFLTKVSTKEYLQISVKFVLILIEICF